MEEYKLSNLNHRRQGKKKQRRKKTGRKKCNEQKTITKILDFNPSIWITTLNVKGLNIPVKRQRLSNRFFFKKTQPYCI